MNSSVKALCRLAGGFALGAAGLAVTSAVEAPSSSGTPYAAIVDRNVFGLKPPPPPVNPAEANKPPPPNIILTGITTILGKKQALMKVSMPPKPPDPAKEQSFIMTVGERTGDIEVLAIDEKIGMVTVNDYGTVTNLTLEKNSPKPAGGAAGPGPGGPAQMGIPPTGGNQPGNRAIPMNRFMRPPGAGGTASPGTASPTAGGAATGTSSGGTTLPGFGVAPAPTTGVPQEASPAQSMSPEEAAAMIELNREATRQQVEAGTAAPLPATSFTPRGAVGIHTEAASPAQTTDTGPSIEIPQPTPSRHMQRH